MLNELKRTFPCHIFLKKPNEVFWIGVKKCTICAVEGCPSCLIKDKMYALDYIKENLRDQQGVKSCDAGLYLHNDTLLLIEFGARANTHTHQEIMQKAQDTLCTIDSLFSSQRALNNIAIFYIFHSPDKHLQSIILNLDRLQNSHNNKDTPSKYFNLSFNNKQFKTSIQSMHCREFEVNYNNI